MELDWKEVLLTQINPLELSQMDCKKPYKQFLMKVVLEQNKKESKEWQNAFQIHSLEVGSYNNCVTNVFEFEIKFPPTPASTREST